MAVRCSAQENQALNGVDGCRLEPDKVENNGEAGRGVRRWVRNSQQVDHR